MSESQKLSRLNLDALTVPEALVNTIRILEMFPAPSSLHKPNFDPREISPEFTPGTLKIDSAMLPGAPGTPPERPGTL